MVWKLYGSHAKPFMRIVYGRPDSRDSYTAATMLPSAITHAAWSPCNKLIAVGRRSPNVVVYVLDSVTLRILRLYKFLKYMTHLNHLIFSPDNHILTVCGSNGGSGVVALSLNLQKADILGTIRWDDRYTGCVETALHSTINGKLFVVLYDHQTRKHSIFICDIASSEHTHIIDFSKGYLPCGFWIQDTSLRLAVVNWAAAKYRGANFITTWEVGFAPGATVTKVETLPTPEPVKSPVRFPQSFTHPQSLPTPRLPVVSCGTNNVLVLDAQTSKILLHLQDIEKAQMTTCSAGGRFFACSIPGSGIYLWKDSPTGYMLHGKLPPPSFLSTPLLSPDGESIIVTSDTEVRLWPTKNFPNILYDIPPDTVFESHEAGFSLEFLPNRPLAAFSRKGDDTVTVLDLRSGVVQLTINTEMNVRALGVTEDTIVAMSHEEATTWKLPEGSLRPGATMNVEDSTQTIEFCFEHKKDLEVEAGSLSPDSRYILVIDDCEEILVFSATDGKIVDRSPSEWGVRLWVTANGRSVGSFVCVNMAYLFEITPQGALTGRQKVKSERGNHGCPCTSSDYEICSMGWVHGPSGERLLKLPPLWRTDMKQQVWSGQFLMLGVLPEPVILEFL